MKMGSDQVKYEVVIQEKNSGGDMVRNVSLMKSNDKQRAIRFFNSKVENMGHYDNKGTRILVVENDEVIRQTKW